jgi:hypothetical protein
MSGPDQRLFEADIASAEFLSGVAKGRWGTADPSLLPEGLAWPKVVLWNAAAPRPPAPERFYVLVDMSGYRGVAPTGTFWDPATKATMEFAKRPKGKADSRVAKVFRTDWENGIAFYHPYDRHAAQTHDKWSGEQPHLIWTSSHTIVDYLEEFHALLQSGDYVGV